mgnify:CR=1 FL=1
MAKRESRYDQALRADITKLLDKWRPVFGLSEYPITIILEDSPLEKNENLAGCITPPSYTRSLISIRRHWEKLDKYSTAMGISLEDLIVHELTHIAHIKSGFDEVRHQVLSHAKLAGVNDAVLATIEKALEDAEEQSTRAMELVLQQAYEAGRKEGQRGN